jgi:hypothetical protein
MSIFRRLRVFLKKFGKLYLIRKRNINENLERMIIINPVLEKRLISANHRLRLKTLFFGISEIMMPRSMLSMKSDL